MNLRTVIAATILALLVALAGGCAEEGPTQLTVNFLVTGEEGQYEFEIDCTSAGAKTLRAERICAKIAELGGDILFPPETRACPLPVPTLYADISGTYLGEKLRRGLVPCSDAEQRALSEWATLLGFERPELIAESLREAAAG